MDDADSMMRAGCVRRGPQKLQNGGGYARGGRVAMTRYVQGEPAPVEGGGGDRVPPRAAAPLAPPMPPRRPVR
jgi:hypothetical protein